MQILTPQELEFLAGLKRSWNRLYCNELAHLLKEARDPCEGRYEIHAITAANNKAGIVTTESRRLARSDHDDVMDVG